MNKRNNATIDIIMEKMLENLPNVDENTALQYAVSVVTFIYVRGSTPAQLAIEQNPKLLSPFHDSLLMLEGCTNSSIIA